MAPVSLSYLPSACVRSSSVSLPHCSFTLPRSCCHLPLMMSRFILLLLSVRDVRCNGEEKLQGMCPRFWGRCGGATRSTRVGFTDGKELHAPRASSFVDEVDQNVNHRGKRCNSVRTCRAARHAPGESWHSHCLRSCVGFGEMRSQRAKREWRK